MFRLWEQSAYLFLLTCLEGLSQAKTRMHTGFAESPIIVDTVERRKIRVPIESVAKEVTSSLVEISNTF